jgi:hypothetical protein
MKNVVRHGLAVVAAVALTTTLASAPASAEVTRLDDGADATASLTDIRVVRAQHGDERVTVRVNFPDLRKKSSANLFIYLDGNRKRTGPEYALATPLFSGGDYSLRRMRNWRFVGTEPVMCDYGMTFRWRRDVVVLNADRGCFGNPAEVRVGLKMRDTADSSHPVTDWLKGRRKFTRWLAAGAGA